MTIAGSVRIGISSGIRSGLNPTIGAPPALATSDPTSGKYVPISAAEYTALGLSPPSSIWQMQEASGSLVDTGTGGITLAPANAPAYQQTVTGWSRKAVSTTDGVGNQNFGSTAAGLPDIAVASAMLLIYAQITSIAGTRGLCLFGTSSTAELRGLVTPALRMLSAANLATGASNPLGAVRPMVIRVNRTLSVCTAYTDQEKLTPTFGVAMTGKQVVIGYSGGAPASMLVLYGAMWSGAAAEMSDAQVKTLLQGLGWSIPWS